MNKMKAVALTHYLPIDDPNSLMDVELEKPVPTGRDLLVATRAIAVNHATLEAGRAIGKIVLKDWA